jgi:Ca2+-binding RTX toxin-like protein
MAPVLGSSFAFGQRAAATLKENKFYDNPATFAAVAKDFAGVIEPGVSINFNGTPIGGGSYQLIDLFDRSNSDPVGYPGTFADIVANMYVRDTYQKGNQSGEYGTSFVATFSYRLGDTHSTWAFLPTIEGADLTINSSTRYRNVVTGHFGDFADITSIRSFPDPATAFTTVGISETFSVQQRLPLANGTLATVGDVVRAGTLSSMFSSPQQFDASLILWEDRSGNVHSLRLSEATPRDTHLFDSPQELGSWIELVKEPGSTWHPDSPTIRLVIKDSHGLQLGMQGFLAGTLDPNDDSLNVWPEVLLDPPSTTALEAGLSWTVDFDVIAVAPLSDSQTYVSPFSVKLAGTPFRNATLGGVANIDAIGTATDNALIGNTGNNKLEGRGGNDTLDGNSGNDTVNGGPGADRLVGGDGSDSYYVDNVGDEVTESNAVLATGGSDTVYSYLASYTLGNNVENGRILATGAANVSGNTLNNVLYAGAGNNVLNGGSGTDTVSYAYGLAGTTGVTVSLAVNTAQSTGGSGSDTLLGIEHLIGSAYADRLTGNSGANSLSGAAGNDTLDGGAGIDTMAGGDGSDGYYVRDSGDIVSETNATTSTGGNDTVYSTLAAYTLTANVENGRILSTTAANLSGNSGNNVLYAGAGNNVLNGGSGTDTVSYAYGLAGTTGVTVNLAVSTAQATSGSDSDTLLSIENLIGSAYADRLTGNSGANSLSGAAGNDTLDGGTGIDTMAGGDGSDFYYVRDTGDVVTESNVTASTGGTDTVYSNLAAYTLGSNIENGRILAAGAANLTGNTLNNVLYAGAGNNVLNGSTGTDTVSYAYAAAGVTVSLASSLAQNTGGSGVDTLLNIDNLAGSTFNDSLTGNTDANNLNAGAGNDLLSGGLGNDTLTGGLGNDTLFVGLGSDIVRFDALLDATTNLDTISDFNVTDDTIQLENAVFTTLATLGTLAAGSFRAGAGFTSAADANDYLIYNSSSGALYYDADGNSAGAAAVQFAVLTGAPVLSNLDFVVT